MESTPEPQPEPAPSLDLQQESEVIVEPEVEKNVSVSTVISDEGVSTSTYSYIAEVVPVDDSGTGLAIEEPSTNAVMKTAKAVPETTPVPRKRVIGEKSSKPAAATPMVCANTVVFSVYILIFVLLLLIIIIAAKIYREYKLEE